MTAPEEHTYYPKPLFDRFSEFQKADHVNSLDFLAFQKDMKRAYVRYKLYYLIVFIAMGAISLSLFESDGGALQKILEIFLTVVLLGIPMMMIEHSHKKMTGVEVQDIEDSYNPYIILYGDKRKTIVVLGLIFGALFVVYFLSLGTGILEALKQGVMVATGAMTTFGFFWALQGWALLVIPILLTVAAM